MINDLLFDHFDIRRIMPNDILKVKKAVRVDPGKLDCKFPRAERIDSPCTLTLNSLLTHFSNSLISHTVPGSNSASVNRRHPPTLISIIASVLHIRPLAINSASKLKATRVKRRFSSFRYKFSGFGI